MQGHYAIDTFWDEEAAVWVASSEKVPGLCTEASTMEFLIDKLKVMVPELLQENGLASSDLGLIPFDVISHVDHAHTHPIH